MDLWSAIFTVIRRWYVSLPILVISVLAMVVIGGKMQPDYQAKASVVLTPPAQKVVNGQSQPFKNQYASDTKTLAAAVYRQVTSTDEQKSLSDDGFSPRYDIALDQFSAIMDIKVTAKSQEQAIDTANQLISETDRNALAIQRQSRPPEDELVRVDKVSLPVDAEVVPGSKTRVMATILLLGLVAAASAAFMVESLATRRRNDAKVGPVDGASPYPAVGPPPGMAVAYPPGTYTYAPAPAPYEAAAPTLVTREAAPAEHADEPVSPATVGAGGHQPRSEADELDALFAEVSAEEPRGNDRNGSGVPTNGPQVINRGRSVRAEEPTDEPDVEHGGVDRSPPSDLPGRPRPVATPARDDAVQPAATPERRERTGHGANGERSSQSSSSPSSSGPSSSSPSSSGPSTSGQSSRSERSERADRTRSEVNRNGAKSQTRPSRFDRNGTPVGGEPRPVKDDRADRAGAADATSEAPTESARGPRSEDASPKRGWRSSPSSTGAARATSATEPDPASAAAETTKGAGRDAERSARPADPEPSDAIVVDAPIDVPVEVPLEAPVGVPVDAPLDASVEADAAATVTNGTVADAEEPATTTASAPEKRSADRRAGAAVGAVSGSASRGAASDSTSKGRRARRSLFSTGTASGTGDSSADEPTEVGSKGTSGSTPNGD